jgi:3-hydroxyisobutyrate dehydrogenase-like beta-hydroxyacid dehydrogenase
MRIGFIGLGQMGTGMAGSLLRAGHELVVYNRSPDKASGLVVQGATLARDVAGACDAEAVVTMLADDHAVESVVLGEAGIAAALPRGALHISCSTIGVALSRRLAEVHGGAGQLYVSAPVFGRPPAAAAAKLFVMAGGAEDAVARARPVLDAIGQRVFVMSDAPDGANLVKLSGNFLIACVIETLGEALALVGKRGIDRAAYIELLTSTLFDAPVYHTYGKLLLERNFEPAGFAAPLGLKDIRLALAAGEELRVPMPVASLLRDRFIALLAQGGEALDWSALGTLAGRDAGEARRD